MKIAIMQPYLFPYIGYWQLINAVDRFVIYDDVNFIKQGYINRNCILENSKKKTFTLELLGASSNKCIKDIKVGRNRSKLVKTIKQNYNKAPCFDEVFPLIEDILTQEEENLAFFIANSIKTISQYLQIDTEFIYSSNINKNNDLKAENKVIDICEKLNAKVYINSIGGKELYSKENFMKKGIELKFLQSTTVKYKQFDNNFIANLSIIDILMFNSIDNIKKMLEEYILI